MLALAASTSAALSNAELYQRVALEKERSFAILANIADGIVAVDREGKVVLWNAAAEKITGVPADDALGRTPVEVLQRTLESESARPPATGSSRSCAGARRCWLSVTEAVMRDPAGAVAGRIFAFRDISSDRLVEQMKSRLRLDGVARAAHAADVDLRLRGDAPAPGRDVRRGGAATFLGYIASESQRLTGDRRRAAERRAAGHRRPAGQPRPDRRARRRRPRSCRARRRRGRRTATASSSTCPRSRSRERRPGQAAPGLLDPRSTTRCKYSPAAGRSPSAPSAGATRSRSASRTRESGSRRPTGADLPEVLPRRRRRVARRSGRHGARALHRARPRDGDGRQDLGRLARRRRLDVRVRVARRGGSGAE